MRRALSITSALLALALWVFFLALEAAVGSYVPPSVALDADLPDYAEFAGRPTVTADGCRYWKGDPVYNQRAVRVCE